MGTPSQLILPYTTYVPDGSVSGRSVAYTLVGRSMNRISYRRYNSATAGSPFIPTDYSSPTINTRAAATIDVRTQVKAPGALGNDRMRISLKDTFLGSDGLYKTDSAELSFSFSRDPNSTSARRQGIIFQLINLLAPGELDMALNCSNGTANSVSGGNARIGVTNIIRMNLDLPETLVHA